MRTKFTLQELRAAGVETVGKAALFGRGSARVAAVADESGVVSFDLVKLSEKNPPAAMLLGAMLAEIEEALKPAPKLAKAATKNADLGAT